MALMAVTRPTWSLTRVVAWSVGVAVSVPASATAQAWTPPAGGGAVTVSVQTIEHTGHRLTDGTYVDNGRSRSGGLFFEADYGITRRFSVSVGLPFVFTRYTDDDPPPPFIPFLSVDQCRCWQSGWQDVGVTARFNLVDTFDHVVIVTPSVSAGVPSHSYNYQGEAVVGRRLKELRVAVDASARLDALSRRVTVSGRYVYAFVQEVIEVHNDRSNATVAMDWRATPALALRGFASWQLTHGGLRFGSPFGGDLPPPGDVTTPERLAEHDRLLRDNSTHVGAGATYHLQRLEIFGSYTHFVGGTDTHAGHALTAGVSVPFQIRR